MCGIVGYIGEKNPIEVLINGLKNLEYRGYDSAGIALKNESQIQVIKSVGKIANLEEKIKNETDPVRQVKYAEEIRKLRIGES